MMRPLSARWLILLVVAWGGVAAAMPGGENAADEPPVAAPDPANDAAADARPFGLTKRIPWTTSRITGSPEPPSPYLLERVFPHLTFAEPVSLVTCPGSPRLFLMELRGKIYSFDPKDPQPQPELFFDLASIEGFRRAYGIAFHPDFATNREIYLCYVLNDGNPDGTRVSRFKVLPASPDKPPQIDPASEQIVLTWYCGGHNGGCLKFGPDGYLYISTGDGSSPFPPDAKNTGQRIDDLLASILRIDVNRAENGLPYAIPDDNPFVGRQDARGEVWAYGFRNPWRMSFDPATGDLWVGDVGWEMWEMIYRVERGGNYGWSLVEAEQVVHRERERGPTPILPPTAAHDHTEARSITGGMVYHGERLKELRGVYVYGDYVTGKIWGLKHDGQKVTWLQELVDSTQDIICFGTDPAGELYVVAYNGSIHRLVENPRRGANTDFPTRLSQTGLFSDVAKHELAQGVIPYDVNVPLWADGTQATRFIGVPGTATLGVHEINNLQVGDLKGAWKYPSDTVLGRTVWMAVSDNPADRYRIETQILHRDGDTWKAYNYIWNKEQTDAILAGPDASEQTLTIADPAAPGGKRQQTWRHASRSECILCHTTRAGTIHGFVPEQLDRDFAYSGPGKTVVDNQLRALAHIGLSEQPVPEDHPVLVDPHDTTAPLEVRVRSYLHVNCGHCHRRGGGGTAAFDVQFTMPLAKTNLIGGRPTQGTFEIHSAALVAPGDPYRSLLLYRMAKLGRGRMPHFGSSVVDTAGVQLIHDWIASLDASVLPKNAPQEPASVAVRQQQEQTLLEAALKSGPGQAAAIQELLATPSGALRALMSLDRFENPAVVIAAGAAHEDVRTRDLFERFVPEPDRVARLGTDIRPNEILRLTGDAQRGRQLFLTAAGLQCRNCHRAQGQGVALGPDFDGLGAKRSREELLESLIEPSKKVDPQYISYVVETGDGHVHQGLLVERSDQAIVLRTPENKQVRVAADNVEFFAPQQKSIMPEMLLRDMTAQQVADLLAYLQSLKQPAGDTSAGQLGTR